MVARGRSVGLCVYSMCVCGCGLWLGKTTVSPVGGVNSITFFSGAHISESDSPDPVQRPIKEIERRDIEKDVSYAQSQIHTQNRCSLDWNVN